MRIRAALGMNAEGVDPTEAESAFSLSDLKLSKSKVDALENAGVDSGDESEIEEMDDESSDDADSDEEYEKMLDAQMDKLYDEFLTRRGDDVKTMKAVKRSKIAKRALAGEAVMEDSALYDGDQEAYRKMINPDEVSDCIRCVDACSPFVLSVPGRSVPLLSCQTWGKAMLRNAFMSDHSCILCKCGPMCILHSSLLHIDLY